MKALKIVFLLLMAVLLALPITGFNWQTHYVSELNNALLTELDVSEGLDPSNLDALLATASACMMRLLRGIFISITPCLAS